MTAVETEPVPQLVTIPNVELVSVGPWSASTGPVEFSLEDLQAMIAALDDPAIHDPRLRIGHTPPNITAEASAGGFEEQPAFGRFTNLRLEGTTIVADAVGVPAWLAEIMPSAFPNRSVEVYWNVSTAAGRTHSAVITSVALLGVSMPAVETLEDLRLAFGAEMPDGVEFTYGDKVAASRGEPMPRKPVSAAVTYTDVRRSFYEEVAVGDQYWWWICDFIMSPATVIVDDDENGYYAIPYTLTESSVEWGDPVEVRIQYVEVESGKVAASRPDNYADRVAEFRVEYVAAKTGERLAAASVEPSFFTAAQSRPIDRVRAANAPKGASMNDEQKKLAVKLGLAEDATEEQLNAKLQADALAAEEPTPADPPADTDPATPPADPAEETGEDDDVETKLTKYANEQLRSRVEKLEQEAADREKADAKARRDKAVADALSDGRIMPSEHDMYRENLDINEAAALKVLASLPKGRVPLSERGQAPNPNEPAEGLEWFPQFAGQTTRKES